MVHASTFLFLLNNYPERLTLNGFNETRRRRGDTAARRRDSDVMASCNGPVTVNCGQGGSAGQGLMDGKQLDLNRSTCIIKMQSDETKSRGGRAHIKVSDLSALARVRYGQIVAFLPTFLWLLTSRCRHKDHSGGG